MKYPALWRLWFSLDFSFWLLICERSQKWSRGSVLQYVQCSRSSYCVRRTHVLDLYGLYVDAFKHKHTKNGLTHTERSTGASALNFLFLVEAELRLCQLQRAATWWFDDELDFCLWLIQTVNTVCSFHHVLIYIFDQFTFKQLTRSVQIFLPRHLIICCQLVSHNCWK